MMVVDSFHGTASYKSVRTETREEWTCSHHKDKPDDHEE